MASASFLDEFRDAWLPHVSDAGLNRIIELLATTSPLLIHGAFSRCLPMGCLATHIAWHHPRTQKLQSEAGIVWLTRIARLNPATSRVILAWDRRGAHDWDLRTTLLAECRTEVDRRQSSCTADREESELVPA